MYQDTTYMPNTDYTDYTDQRISYIIWEDNINVIFPTTLSFNTQLWYCSPVLSGLYQHTTYMPNTDYTDYRVGYIISEHNVYVIFPTA